MSSSGVEINVANSVFVTCDESAEEPKIIPSPATNSFSNLQVAEGEEEEKAGMLTGKVN